MAPTEQDLPRREDRLKVKSVDVEKFGERLGAIMMDSNTQWDSEATYTNLLSDTHKVGYMSELHTDYLGVCARSQYVSETLVPSVVCHMRRSIGSRCNDYREIVRMCRGIGADRKGLALPFTIQVGAGRAAGRAALETTQPRRYQERLLRRVRCVGA